MSHHLAARTAFFDRSVVSALDDGFAQVIVAAGYDGRALRYAKPGVKWWELDHPDTQREKCARLDRLKIATPQVTYVPVDFNADDVAGALDAHGVMPSVTSLVLCEGLSVYLARPVLGSLLGAHAASVAPGSRLAISVSRASTSVGQSARRHAFQARVANLGESAPTVLLPSDARRLLAERGWQSPGAAAVAAEAESGLLMARRA